MVQKQIVQYFDDLDGSRLDAGVASENTFSLNGTDYIIDLSPANAEKLAAALAPFIEAARKATPGTTRRRRRTSGATTAEREHNRRVRQWAKDEGYDIADRGKIAERIFTAYAKAHAS